METQLYVLRNLENRSNLYKKNCYLLFLSFENTVELNISDYCIKFRNTSFRRNYWKTAKRSACNSLKRKHFVGKSSSETFVVFIDLLVWSFALLRISHELVCFISHISRGISNDCITNPTKTLQIQISLG